MPWWCPVNEVSFWAWAGGDRGVFPPFAHGRSFELKVQLARAALAAADAVRGVDPRARLLWAEPVVHVVPAAPEHAAEAEGYRQAQFQAFDLLSGLLWPQIGGTPEVLDVVGLNYYPQNQWVHHGDPLPPDDPRRRPFREMLAEVWHRYGRAAGGGRDRRRGRGPARLAGRRRGRGRGRAPGRRPGRRRVLVPRR